MLMQTEHLDLDLVFRAFPLSSSLTNLPLLLSKYFFLNYLSGKIMQESKHVLKLHHRSV